MTCLFACVGMSFMGQAELCLLLDLGQLVFLCVLNVEHPWSPRKAVVKGSRSKLLPMVKNRYYNVHQDPDRPGRPY